MAIAEALDREVIIERAEELRLWLLGIHLSERSARAIQHELRGIIDDDPGGYLHGRRPLAGLTSAEFIAELYSTNGGAVGRVKHVGDLALRELRAAIPPPARGPRPRPEAVPEPAAELAQVIPAAAPEPAAELAQAIPAAAPAPAIAASAEAPAPTRRRGRPKGSTKAAMAARAAAGRAEPLAPAEPRRRGRPRRSIAPALSATPPAILQLARDAGEGSDQALSELKSLWPALHPHARRAVMLYASMLLAEASLDA